MVSALALLNLLDCPKKIMDLLRRITTSHLQDGMQLDELTFARSATAHINGQPPYCLHVYIWQ